MIASAIASGASERLLSRLEGVRQTAPEQYVARCPAHDDKSPSLSIRAVDDRVLVHCFSGCDAEQIVYAVGLNLADLFDQPLHSGPIPKRQRWDSYALMRQMQMESYVVLIAANQVSERRPLSIADQKRLCEAVERIGRIAEIAL